ncbi:hypothetical protein GCK72_011269 [Caenorhabditis remanei]|uniref:Uncharacterized protein n=1 Tax=Caenorhabditis remanei TaxID=31234 RepID=A0A6A5H879_CAERE|nr:hypothetical protein GCK72_011269 [Caenorhabditis remanei]KAF1763004.1 hypothetical protein GCK72_011269 [Caenorhabditis remanei]
MIFQSRPNNIVYWSSKVFNEKLTDKLESITKLFDDPSVLNPFEFVNGALSNRYGPEQQYFFLDFAILKNHDENHANIPCNKSFNWDRKCSRIVLSSFYNQNTVMDAFYLF